MAVSINTGGTYLVTRVSDAESQTNWNAETLEGAGGGAGLLSSVGTIDLVAEGSDAVASRTNKQRVVLFFDDGGSYDFTTDTSGGGTTAVPDGNIYIWAAFLAAGSAFTIANGGLQIMLGDGTNRSFWNVAGSDTYSGGFQKWAVNTNITESENDGTSVDIGNVTEIGFVTDVGGTTTRFDNFVVDAMEVGKGLTFQGTTASDALFSESQVIDEATAIGILSEENGIIFSQGSLEFSGTAQTSIAETLVFTDTLGGAYTYECDITGTIVMTNSIINGSGAVDFNFDTSGATAFTMTGGSLGGFNILTTASGQTISGAVFQSGGASTIANAVESSSFNQCGQITLTGSLSKCVVDKSTASTAIVVVDLDKIVGGSITSNGTGHAVELTTAVDGSWTTETSGYDAGATGEPITTTEVGVDATGDETILITAASGTVNIAVSGVTTPSVAIANGSTVVVNVTGFKPTLTITGIQADSSANISGGAPSSEVRIYETGTTTELTGIEDVVETTGGSKIGTFSYQYAYPAPTNVDIVIHHYDYQYLRLEDVTLGAGDANLPIQQIFDRNYSNP